MQGLLSMLNKVVGLACLLFLASVIGFMINEERKKSWLEEGGDYAGEVNVEWLREESGEDLNQICDGELSYLIATRQTEAARFEVLCPNYSEYVQMFIPSYDTVLLSQPASDAITELLESVK